MAETALTGRECPVCHAPSEPDQRFSPRALRRCVSCDFRFAVAGNAAPEDLYDDDYFASYAGGAYGKHEEQRRHESRARLDWIGRWSPPPARLLEIGSAAGFFLDEARSRGYEVEGIEVNSAMAEHARRALQLDVEDVSLEDAALPQGALRLACAWHVLEHMSDPLAAVRKLASALAHGGHLFLEVPNAESALARRSGPEWPALELPYHVGQFGRRSLLELIARSGLVPVAVDTVPFASYGRHRLGVITRTTRVAVESLRARTWLPLGPDLARHQLLRAVAVRER